MGYFSNYADADFDKTYATVTERITEIITDPQFLGVQNTAPFEKIIKALSSYKEVVFTKDIFLDLAFEHLYRVLRDAALLQYLWMEKTSTFGPMGEQRVSISLCRNLLHIPNDREVTQFDADRFRRLLDEYNKTL